MPSGCLADFPLRVERSRPFSDPQRRPRTRRREEREGRGWFSSGLRGSLGKRGGARDSGGCRRGDERVPMGWLIGGGMRDPGDGRTVRPGEREGAPERVIESRARSLLYRPPYAAPSRARYPPDAIPRPATPKTNAGSRHYPVASSATPRRSRHSVVLPPTHFPIILLAPPRV